MITRLLCLGLAALTTTGCTGNLTSRTMSDVEMSSLAEKRRPRPTATPSPTPTATPAPTATPTPTATPITTVGLIRGVNLSGGEYSLENESAIVNQGYTYPNRSEVDYFASKNFKMIRIPFDANRVQKQRNGALDTNELASIDEILNYATSKGLKVLLDPHNYGKLNDDSNVSRLIGVDPLMPSSMLADFWKKMAQHYASNLNVVFGLMNEPYEHSAIAWKNVAVDSVNAIRSTGSKNLILIPGTRWTGAHSWVGSGNAAAWSGFRDSNFAYEMHQYLDSDSSGTSSTCVVGNGALKLREATDWARAQGAKVLLGEIGWSSNAQCMTEGDAITKFMSDNRDVWMGYTYWAAGPWWGEYMFTLEPQGLGTTGVTDRPQLSILLSYQ